MKTTPQTTQIDLNDIPNPSKFRPKNTPIELLIDLRKKRLSYAQIGKLLGLDKSGCMRRLQPLYESMELADCYKRNKSEILNYKQSRLLYHLNEDAIKEMQPYQRVVAASILYDKQRLEDGLSTSNIDIHSKIADVSANIQQLRCLIDNTQGLAGNDNQQIDNDNTQTHSQTALEGCAKSS